jgi:hypothetical protein
MDPRESQRSVEVEEMENGSVQALEPQVFQRPTSRRLLYMFGAVTQIELKSFLDVSSIDSDERKKEIRSRWLDAAAAFQFLAVAEAGRPDTVTIRNFPDHARSFIDELQGRQAFQRTFSNYPISIVEAEIDNIVAGQRSVHLDFVEQILGELHGAAPADLYRFCLGTGEDETSLQVARTGANAFTFSSANPGLRFLGAFEEVYRPETMEVNHTGGQPIHSVTLLVGYGCATVNAYRVGHRLILNNGFHRLYLLRSLGVTHAPLVVQEIQHPQLELPPNIAELSRDYLISAPRPALMKDFFDERLSCEVHQRSVFKALQVGWGVNESLVPQPK